MPRKLIGFEPEIWQALSLLSQDEHRNIQDLADEAFADLLKKHKRPVTLKEALRDSTRQVAANDAQPAGRRPGRRPRGRPAEGPRTD